MGFACSYNCSLFVSNSNPPFSRSPRNGTNPSPKLNLGDRMSAFPIPGSDEESINLQLVLSVLQRRWWILLLVSSVISTVMGIRVFQEDPLYRSSFRLLVEPIASDQRFDQFSQSLVNQLGLEFDYDTQIQVLQSPTVLQPIVKQIQAKYELDYHGLVGSMTINQLEGTKILEVGFQDSDPNKIRYILDALSIGFIDYSRVEQKTGREKGLDFVETQLTKQRKAVNQLQEQVEAFRKRHNLLDPDVQGEAVANRLNTIVEERRGVASSLQETDKLYAKLQEQLGLDLDTALVVSALSEAPRYQGLLNDLKDVETELALESTRFSANHPEIARLRDRRDKLLPLVQVEAAKVLGTAAERSPDFQAIAPNSIRLQLTQAFLDATNDRQVLAVRSAALALAEGQTRKDIQNFARLSREYSDLQRELTVATESLSRFLAVQQDLQIESAQRTAAWDLLNAPETPLYPIAPNVPRGLALSIVAGLLAGIGTTLIAEKLDVRFHSADELKEMARLPLLGTIPYRKEFKGKTGVARTLPLRSLSQRYRTSPFLEAFRSLNANLSFFTPDKPLQVLLVSSSVPLEGKSTTSIHLAQTAAAMGQRVLLVDADLRRPQVHAMTDLPNVWGLSHVISMDIDPEEVIQQSPNDENLFVLTSGQIPPDPTRLLSSQRMHTLVQTFRQRYDLVIFDTPPMLGLADAKFLAVHTDVMLLVVRLGWTDRNLFKQVLEAVKVSQTSGIGLVANGVKDLSSGSYYYYHRYFSDEQTVPQIQDQIQES
ncbi:MAG: polysaccharide biosynthesis tyrosine autokinase [Spirulina sp. SIO3F2]|nr:polysaccharide biosynthesis tyrosine autokinase [Spirulina sp. SIO3F2]